MKAFLALAGVAVFGTAVFFIARGRMLPNTSGKQAAGNLPNQPANPARQNIAASLLTSQNIAAVGGLYDKIFGTGGGGAAVPASPGGTNGSGFVTSL